MDVCRPASNVMYFVVPFRMSLGSDLNISEPGRPNLVPP